jgi:hypothetical protein
MGLIYRLYRPKAGRKLGRMNRFVPRLENLEDRTVLSTLTVLNNLDSGAGSLRDAITSAKSGDTIVFAASLNGQTITLTGGELAIKNSLDIEGPGASLLAISGDDTNRVFDISEGLTVTIARLTIAHGLGKGNRGGGGILNVGSILNLANDMFSSNTAFYPGRSYLSQGGAVANWNGATLTVTECTFTDNQANAQGSGSGIALGGAISNNSDGAPGSTLTILNSAFLSNAAIGGDGGTVSSGQTSVGTAEAGAINNGGHSSLTVLGSTFSGNMAIAGNGGSGGNGAAFYAIDGAVGGAIQSGENTTLAVDGCTFTHNIAMGGSNAIGGASGSGRLGLATGGALDNQNLATVRNSTFIGNHAIGGSNDRASTGFLLVGRAAGGAIDNWFFPGEAPGTLIASNLRLSNNEAVGGNDDMGGPFAGDGIGGGLSNQFGATATVSYSTFTDNQALGGQGSTGDIGSEGLGGGFANTLGATLTVSNCSLAGNQAIGGAGGSGANGGNGFGGGLYNDGHSAAPQNAGAPAALMVTDSTITDNSATGGAAGSGSAGMGVGGGVYLATGGNVCLDDATLLTLVGNLASTRNNEVFGVFTIC